PETGPRWRCRPSLPPDLTHSTLVKELLRTSKARWRMKASSPNGTHGDACSSPGMNRSGRWYSRTTRSRLVSLIADTSGSHVAADGYQHLDDVGRRADRALDRLPHPGEREAVGEQRGDRVAVLLGQPDRGAEIRGARATRTDDVDLLLREDSRAQRRG